MGNIEKLGKEVNIPFEYLEQGYHNGHEFSFGAYNLIVVAKNEKSYTCKIIGIPKEMPSVYTN